MPKPIRAAGLFRCVFAAVALAWCVGAGAAGQTPADATRQSGLFHEVSGAGDAVVLIHAFSLDHRMWAREVEDLAPRFRVITYDLAGHGRSPMPDGPFFAHEQLGALLDELGVGRAALVGISAGAGIAVDFALEHPDRVTRLVLASPSVAGYVPSGMPPGLAPVFEAARAGDAAKAAELWAGTEMMRAPDADQAAVRQMVMDNASLWALASNPQRPISPPAWGRVEEIRAATLVIHGGRDTADVRAIADGLVERIPGAEGLALPDAGHLLNFDPAFTAAVRGFLQR